MFKYVLFYNSIVSYFVAFHLSLPSSPHAFSEFRFFFVNYNKINFC